MTNKQTVNLKSTPAIGTDPAVKSKGWLWMIGAALITLVCYAPVFSDEKEFTNWDDDLYITSQPLITSLSSDTLKKMFDPATVVVYHYHPLTLLSLAIDYQRAYDEDTQSISIAPFVRTNILLHLLNTMLVFVFIYQLSKRKILPAIITSLLFGLHPMHVESVAWMSERKDLLYCVFFLLSCMTYLRYLHTEKYVFLGLSVILFIASCLSKAMAVPLPAVLLLTDFLYRRRFSLRLLLEKLPYFACALLIGIQTLSIQQGPIPDSEAFSIGQRLLFIAGTYLLYWAKLLVPFNLSAFYPFPDVAGGALPAFYYAAPLLALVITAIPLWWMWRKAPEHFRQVAWGVGFFILMIALMLPVFTVGSIIMADRYTYVSSIGLFFLLTVLLQVVLDHSRFKKIALGAAGLCIAGYAVQTYGRIQVWENSKVLWTDVIRKYPIATRSGFVKNAGAKTAYKNLADYYASGGDYDSAFLYYQPLIATNTKDAQVWSNVANVYVVRKDTANALKALNKSISLDSLNYETYLKRGIVQANTENYTEAVKNLDKVIQLNPADTQTKTMRAKMAALIKK